MAKVKVRKSITRVLLAAKEEDHQAVRGTRALPGPPSHGPPNETIGLQEATTTLGDLPWHFTRPRV